MNTDLWQKIETFELDDLGSDFKFSDRLARENSWTLEFAKRSINEYKKFLYLAAEAGHPVTPSVAVDHVWHLHLCYTRNYWNDLCKQTLNFPLHHGPTKGGTQENQKFNQWYQKTLDSYQRLFQTEPPSDIWPTPELRFSPQDIKNVDYNKHFVIPKKLALTAAATLALSFTVVGCASILNNPDFPIGTIIFVTIVVVVVAKIFKSGGGKGGGCGGGGSSCGGGNSCGSGCSSGCGGGGCGGGCGS
ncbi:MAG: glycine-rich domain-containing protein [Akkermansiaceae bacterium]